MDVAKLKTLVAQFQSPEVEARFRLLRTLIDIYVIRNDEKSIEDYLKAEGLLVDPQLKKIVESYVINKIKCEKVEKNKWIKRKILFLETHVLLDSYYVQFIYLNTNWLKILIEVNKKDASSINQKFSVKYSFSLFLSIYTNECLGICNTFSKFLILISQLFVIFSKILEEMCEVREIRQFIHYHWRDILLWNILTIFHTLIRSRCFLSCGFRCTFWFAS